MKKMLIVDDEQKIVEGLGRVLHQYLKGWEFDFASNGKEAIEKLQQEDFSVMITDIKMPVLNGYELLRYAESHCPGMLRIVLSGYMDSDLAQKSIPLANHLFAKPFAVDRLKDIIGSIH